MIDSDFPLYFEQAKAMLPAMNERSQEYREGYHYGLVFVLAGSCWDWRRDVPYGTGYAERDAWLSGFENGRERAKQEVTQ
ncbi:hypothetical protein LG290_16610 (plasmid) [Halomonas sediminis]